MLRLTLPTACGVFDTHDAWRAGTTFILPLAAVVSVLPYYSEGPGFDPSCRH
jgi:hypothetical protein